VNDSVIKALEIALQALPVLIGGYALFALIVGIRAVLIARKDAYEAMHKDFLALKDRVNKELSKD